MRLLSSARYYLALPSKYCPSRETFHTPARLLRVDVVRIIWADGRSLWRRHRELSVVLVVNWLF